LLEGDRMSLFNNLIVFSLPVAPKFLVHFFAKKYIAGPRLANAIDVIHDLNFRGMSATVDLLGEEISDRNDALQVVTSYKEVLSTIYRYKLDSNISIKPTHLGLKIEKEFCFNNIRELILEAKKYNNFVRIDMEDHTCTTDTIEIYLRLQKEFSNVGLVIQAYLRRTIDDLNLLIKHKANLRLCKGIYIESRQIAYKDGLIINYNFTYGLEKLLTSGCYVGIATHDEKIVWQALALIDKLGLDKDKYEFQMLLGVDESLRNIIVSAGHRLRIYVPFGEKWYSYSIRRLKENPSIARNVLKSIFSLH
jgi:proline dehydrogenase